MKHLIIPTIALAFAFSPVVRAQDTIVKLSGVHLCCKSCVTGIEKAIGTVPGVTASADKDKGTVTITAPNDAVAQKALNAMIAAGYYGISSHEKVRSSGHSGAPDAKVKSVTVTGVHLCCGKCAKAANGAATSVPGVKTSNAEKGAPSFTVTGDFNGRDLAMALEKAGMHGKIAK